MRATHELRFTLECLNAERCTVSFEPEGAQVNLGEGEMITVEISSGREPREPEISYVPGGVIVGAWAGALTRVWKDGEELSI